MYTISGKEQKIIKRRDSKRGGKKEKKVDRVH